jgi:hypothetical protein
MSFGALSNRPRSPNSATIVVEAITLIPRSACSVFTSGLRLQVSTSSMMLAVNLATRASRSSTAFR